MQLCMTDMYRSMTCRLSILLYQISIDFGRGKKALNVLCSSPYLKYFL